MLRRDIDDAGALFLSERQSSTIHDARLMMAGEYYHYDIV
jgi:hypothetical protein